MNLESEFEKLRNVGIIPSVALAINNAPHSFEFGPASSRHKIYYEDLADLTAKIKIAVEAENYLKSLTNTEVKL